MKIKLTPMLMILGCVVPLTLAQGERNRDHVCFPGEGSGVENSPQPTRDFLPHVERFAYAFFNQISQKDGEKSMLISPFSIWSVLTLTYFGSLGTTQREIESALGFQNKTSTLGNFNGIKFYFKNGAGLDVANRGYFSNKLSLNSCLTSRVFDIQLVDFSRPEVAKTRINQEVSEITRGRIRELITFLPSSTRFALVNAVFFKGTWEGQFDPKLTVPHEFLVPPGRSSGVVQMMNRVAMMNAGHVPSLSAHVLELPYKDIGMSMLLILPDNPNEPTINLISKLNPNTIADALNLTQKLTLVKLSLPKFNLTSRYEEELQMALHSLGITTLFDPSRANLQGFVPNSNLFVDTTIHQATIEVNEEGTVAAAATTFINTRIGQQEGLDLVFNRPFVFIILDKNTKIPLFLGKVTSAKDLVG